MVVLQELIQNAEDAGAQRITFMLDHSSYSQREAMLHDGGLALFQVRVVYICCLTSVSACLILKAACEPSEF